MENIDITIRGLAPLLMHNGQLADPMNDHTKALKEAIHAVKKNKTDAAFEAAAKVEFMGGLYVDDNGAPCIPGELIEAMIIEGAKKSKMGKQAKASVIVAGNYPLQYKGPKDAEKLWKAKFFKTCGVKVGQNRVMRTRPMFVEWELSFAVSYNPELLNKKDIMNAITKAGAEVGLCDYRPRYGRFEVL